MSIFDSIFSKSKSGKLPEQWFVPQTVGQIGKIFMTDSGTHLVYKHSYACGICIFSKRELESLFSDSSGLLQYTFIDVRTNRELSDYIAERSGIKHESPQALLIKDGCVLWHASHSHIRAENIRQEVEKT